MTRIPARIAAVALILCSCAFAHAAESPHPITISIDAREAPRHLLHTRLVIPAAPGELTLAFPKWLPGTHMPCGAIDSMAGLQLSASGKPIDWRRDDVDMYLFHCTVPPGAESIEAQFDFLVPTDRRSMSRVCTTGSTPNLMVLNWEGLLLYPLDKSPESLEFKASLRLPADWKFASALVRAKKDGEPIEFDPVSLVTLIDSPLLAGRYFRAIPLSTEAGPMHELDLAAESEAELEIKPKTVDALKSLVKEAQALFGAHHYRDYHFLVAASDALGRVGWEHHQSSDNRVGEKAVTSDDPREGIGGLLAHEFTHSWCGKYRRPAGLATPNYQEPMKGELLWVYEGLTSYLGNVVLATRCGVLTPEKARDMLAHNLAMLDQEPGRRWRSLEDTAAAAQLTYDSPSEWASYRRGTDFYREGALIWQEADVLIRQQSGGRRSLDDFCRSFFGGDSGAPMVKTYTFDDLVKAMNEISPYDWASFFRTRVYTPQPHAPSGAVERAGWKLIFNDKRTDARRPDAGAPDFWFSLGLSLGKDGSIGDVAPGLAADRAGLSPDMKLIAVNGRRFAPQKLLEATKQAKASGQPIDLIVENGDVFKTCHLDAHAGMRYPHLERDNTNPDLLSDILRPLTKPPTTQPATQPTAGAAAP